MKPHRFLISGGGTGGHIFPAIAIANEIKVMEPDAIIEFVGASDRMEMEKVPAAGYKIHGIWITGFQRELTLKNLSFPLKVVSSLWSCYQILRSFKPDVVIGTGGFASGPLLKVACWLKIKTVIQEQNSYAGVTNKLLGKKVDTICLGFEKAKTFFPASKCVVTGNPVRQSILSLPERKQSIARLQLDPDKKTLLVIGGSLGALSINQAMDAMIETLDQNNIQLIWQTGKNYTAVHQPKFGLVSAFIENMETVYSAADIIVSRAGAIAITELCIVGKPVILIPSPHVAEDHQTKNAMALVEKEAALLVKNSEANTQLWPAINSVLTNMDLAQNLSLNLKKLEKPQAAKGIVAEIYKLLNN